MRYTVPGINILLQVGFIMNEYNSKGYVFIKSFIDPDSIKTISQYLENKLICNEWGNSQGNGDESSPYIMYSDSLIEVVLKNSIEHIEEIVGYPVYPTYSYARIYLKGDELKAHVDRPACEISVTVHVATVGEAWPIWMHPPGGEPVSYTLEPGDAVIYKGCEVRHWREKAINTDINVQFMLHYVKQDGIHADQKWDKRPKLGYRQTHRRK
jgi:hypothetical protein